MAARSSQESENIDTALHDFVAEHQFLCRVLDRMYTQTRTHSIQMMNDSVDITEGLRASRPLLASARQLMASFSHQMQEWMRKNGVGEQFSEDNASGTTAVRGAFFDDNASVVSGTTMRTALYVDDSTSAVSERTVVPEQRVPFLPPRDPMIEQIMGRLVAIETKFDKLSSSQQRSQPEASSPKPSSLQRPHPSLFKQGATASSFHHRAQDQLNQVAEKREAILATLGAVDTEFILFDEEFELFKAQTECPCAIKFISIEDFTSANLPAPFRKDDGFSDCLFYLAQLSVKLKVRKISKHRPLTFPDSQTPYPFSDYQGEDIVRLGSGFVCEVTEFKEDVQPCWCTTCESTNSPEREFIEVKVVTATHLIFDEYEAKHSDIEIQFEGCTQTLTGGRWEEAKGGSFHREKSFVTFCTHDRRLVEKLFTLWLLGMDRKQALDEMYDDKSHGGLVIMLGHLHGAERVKVSIGTSKFWAHKAFGLLDRYQLSHTAPSCLGYSGAIVWPVGLREPGSDSHYVYIHNRRKPNGDQVTGWQ